MHVVASSGDAGNARSRHGDARFTAAAGRYSAAQQADAIQIANACRASFLKLPKASEGCAPVSLLACALATRRGDLRGPPHCRPPGEGSRCAAGVWPERCRARQGGGASAGGGLQPQRSSSTAASAGLALVRPHRTRTVPAAGRPTARCADVTSRAARSISSVEHTL